MNDIINEVIKNVINASIQGFFAGFGRIKKVKDIERINYLIDKLLTDNFKVLRDAFKKEDEKILYEKYSSVLENIKARGKTRYIKFNILCI